MSPVVAFYAPLKSPHHPAPSGDRAMARLLMRSLSEAGFNPELASEFRALDKAGDPKIQAVLRVKAEREADALIARYRAGRRPDLWFTYHVYYKAPDWIGPLVADALRIPYVIAEGSRASKRAGGPWSVGHRGSEAALDRADAVFVMTEQDREALERDRPPRQTLIDLPPFLDAEWASAERPAREPGAPKLLAVAMMRPGDKLASYRLLAIALRPLVDRPWTLTVAGDGEARGEVEALFAGLDRVRFLGTVESPEALRRLYDAADLLVWPAVNEAYGMALLEAQARGCPVVAGAYGGVASVVRDGETGRLLPPGDAPAFMAAVAALLDDKAQRERLGAGAHRFVAAERSLAHGAARLRTGLQALLTKSAA